MQTDRDPVICVNRPWAGNRFASFHRLAFITAAQCKPAPSRAVFKITARCVDTIKATKKRKTFEKSASFQVYNFNHFSIMTPTSADNIFYVQRPLSICQYFLFNTEGCMNVGLLLQKRTYELLFNRCSNHPALSRKIQQRLMQTDGFSGYICNVYHTVIGCVVTVTIKPEKLRKRLQLFQHCWLSKFS